VCIPHRVFFRRKEERPPPSEKKPFPIEQTTAGVTIHSFTLKTSVLSLAPSASLLKEIDLPLAHGRTHTTLRCCVRPHHASLQGSSGCARTTLFATGKKCRLCLFSIKEGGRQRTHFHIQPDLIYFGGWKRDLLQYNERRVGE